MDELKYLRQRIAKENEAARNAATMEAEIIHHTLSATYAHKALLQMQSEESDQPDEASDPQPLKSARDASLA